MRDTKESPAMDRRSFLRRAAMVAWATPVLLTLAQSRAGAQTTCVPCGGPCMFAGMPCCGGCVCVTPDGAPAPPARCDDCICGQIAQPGQ
jgi:hypothetical protein